MRNHSALISADQFGLDWLHRASVRLKSEFSLDMDRYDAQANIGARAILFNCANQIFREHGIGITRKEVEIRR